MQNLKNYDLIKTEDGSYTLFSKLYNEACHSLSGARDETNKHYIQGCDIDNKSKSLSEIHILEIGFGTGIGFEETLKVCKKNQCFLNFTSLEIDLELKNFYLKTSPEETSEYNLNIKIGNARETIKELIESKIKFSAIYQDAFSPKRNSILWTTQWFQDLLICASEDCIMSTYSASSSIRKSMVVAGWKVYEGEKFGPKRTSTRAKVHGHTSQTILEKLQRSPAVELTDTNYQQYKMES